MSTSHKEAPKVGAPFSMDTINSIIQEKELELNKITAPGDAPSSASIETDVAKKMAMELVALGIIAGIGVTTLGKQQKYLLFGNLADSEIVSIIGNDISDYTEKTLAQLGMNASNNFGGGLRASVVGSITNIYSSSMAAESKKLKTALTKMNKDEQMEYLKSIPQIPEGNLIRLTRKAAGELLLTISNKNTNQESSSLAMN